MQPARLLCPWDSPGKNTGVGCHFLLRGSSPPRDQTRVFCVSCIAGRFFIPLSHLRSPHDALTLPGDKFNLRRSSQVTGASLASWGRKWQKHSDEQSPTEVHRHKQTAAQVQTYTHHGSEHTHTHTTHQQVHARTEKKRLKLFLKGHLSKSNCLYSWGISRGKGNKLENWDWHTHTTLNKTVTKKDWLCSPGTDAKYSVMVYMKKKSKNSGYMYNWYTLLYTWN